MLLLTKLPAGIENLHAAFTSCDSSSYPIRVDPDPPSTAGSYEIHMSSSYTDLRSHTNCIQNSTFAFRFTSVYAWRKLSNIKIRTNIKPMYELRKRILLGSPTLIFLDAKDLGPGLLRPSVPDASAPVSSGSPSWRILHSKCGRLQSGPAQSSYPQVELTTIHMPTDSTIEESLCHSFATRTAWSDDSLPLSPPDDNSLLEASSHEQDMPPLVSLTELEDVPSAASVVQKPPHTISITALVGIIAIEPTRTVQTRFGTEMRVTVVIVGDDTAAGFRIDVWTELRPTTVAGHELKAFIDNLQVQDVIVIRNVFLSVFRGIVYGQTKGWGLSSINLVHRVQSHMDSGRRQWGIKWDSSLAGRKVGRVVGWVKGFVGNSDNTPDDTPAY